MSHILLIEPNTLLAKTYSQALQHVGYSVDHVTGAQAAVDAADRKMPDIVVAELHLPHHSGIEFLHEFRSYAEWMHIPIILNTSLSTPKISPLTDVLHRDLGIREILYKPRASLQDLVRAVREHALAA